MEDNKLIREFPVTVYGNLTKYSDTISKARVRIFYRGSNRNGTYISDEFAEKLLSTISYSPVKGIFEELEDDFSDHGTERDLGRIYGVVPESHNFAWEKFLDEYTLNGRKIKKVSMIDSKSFKEKDVFDIDGNINKIIGEYGQNKINGQWIKAKESHQGQIAFKENNKWKIVPVYVFESKYLKLKQYKEKYNDILFFKTGDLVELTKSYDNVKAGIYK